MARHHPIPPCGRATRTSRPFLHASAANVSKKALLSGLAISAFATSVAPVLAQPTDEEAPERRSEVPGRTRDADGMATLPEVRTQGKARVGEYADGRMASESRVGFLGERDFMETPFSTVTYTEAFIADHQAKDISEVISRTDPTVSISGIPGESNESCDRQRTGGHGRLLSKFTRDVRTGRGPQRPLSPSERHASKGFRGRVGQPGDQARTGKTIDPVDRNLRLRFAVRRTYRPRAPLR